MLENITNNQYFKNFYNTASTALNHGQKALTSAHNTLQEMDACAKQYYKGRNERHPVFEKLGSVMSQYPSTVVTTIAGSLLGSGINDYCQRRLLPGTVKVILASSAFAVSASENSKKAILGGGMALLFLYASYKDDSIRE